MTSEMTDDEMVQARHDQEKKLEFHENFENLSEDDRLKGVLQNIGMSDSSLIQLKDRPRNLQLL